jgi:hypothetical protein
MNSANGKVEVKGGAAAVGGNGAFGLPLFEFPRWAIPAGFGGMAQQHAIQAKENCDCMKAASDELMAAFRNACVGNAGGVVRYGGKVIDKSNANAASAFDFFSRLMGTKSAPEFIELSAAHARESFATIVAQHHDLWNAAYTAVTAAVAPARTKTPSASREIS